VFGDRTLEDVLNVNLRPVELPGITGIVARRHWLPDSLVSLGQTYNNQGGLVALFVGMIVVLAKRGYTGAAHAQHEEHQDDAAREAMSPREGPRQRRTPEEAVCCHLHVPEALEVSNPPATEMLGFCFLSLGELL
jgi:hypothetical protein